MSEELTDVNPDNWALLVPKKNANRLTNNESNEPVPVEEIKYEGHDNCDADSKEVPVEHDLVVCCVRCCLVKEVFGV